MKRIMMVLLMGMLPFAYLNAEEETGSKETPVTMEELDKQIDVCKELMDQKDAKNRPLVSSSTKSSILKYFRSIKKYLGEKRFRYVSDNCANIYNYSVPDIVRKEIDKSLTICNQLAKQGKAKMLDEGNALYQEVIDITDKNTTEDDIDTLSDKVEIIREKIGHIVGSNPEFRRIYKKLEKATRFLQYWSRFSAARQDGNYSNAISQLDTLISNYSSYSVLPTKVLRTKKAALLEEAVTKFDAEIKVMRKALEKADGSECVKKVVNMFTVFNNKYSNSLRNTTRYNEMSYTNQALTYWLNVITYEESGDFKQAISSLNSFNSGYYRNTLLLKWNDIKQKKQELVKKMLSAPKSEDPVIKSVDEHIKSCKDLKSLIAFKSKLQDLINNYSGNHSQELYALQTDLQALANIDKALKSGNFAQVFQLIQYQQNQAHRWNELLDRYRGMIRLEAVAAVADVDVKKLQNKEKKPGKIILEFADKAAENKEWGNVYLLLNAYAMAFCPSGVRPVWLCEEILGCKSFMTGKNFEKAGMFHKAISNYVMVLQQKESKRIPLEEAIERVNAIRENNPNLFDPKTGALINLVPKHSQQPDQFLPANPSGYRLEEELDVVPLKPIKNLHKR